MKSRAWLLLAGGSLLLLCAVLLYWQWRHAAHISARRQQAEWYIDQQIRKSEPPVSSELVANYRAWSLGMQRAKASLDALQAGRVKTVPLAAFIRPLPSGNYVLVVWWQQSDEGLRKITVRDGSRVLAEFVASEPETEACLTFLQHITVRIATQPPYDGGKYCSPHEQIVRIERDIDQVSLSICIAPVVDATSQDEETIPVVWLDRLSEEYLQKRLEQAAEQRQMLEIAREAWHEAQQELAEERKHAATQESR